MIDNKTWNEDTIREEIRRLDKITGLQGSVLQITFGNAKYTLGSFHIDVKTREPKKFHFSRFYYNNPEWSNASALDTIRHEYAHYMDYMLHGNLGHGSTWKKCCCKVGASPTRLYSEEIEKIFKKQEEERKLSIKQISRFRLGDCIKHPKFGTGIIKSISGIPESPILDVKFSKNETKKLSAAWVSQNCSIL